MYGDLVFGDSKETMKQKEKRLDATQCHRVEDFQHFTQ